MRALTQEEYEALRRHDVDEDLDSDDYLRMVEVWRRLADRGLIALTLGQDENGECCSVDITPLGHLALRVSRPEMAWSLP